MLLFLICAESKMCNFNVPTIAPLFLRYKRRLATILLTSFDLKKQF